MSDGDRSRPAPDRNRLDRLDSFFFAETLKYLSVSARPCPRRLAYLLVPTCSCRASAPSPCSKC